MVVECERTTATELERRTAATRAANCGGWSGERRLQERGFVNSREREFAKRENEISKALINFKIRTRAEYNPPL